MNRIIKSLFIIFSVSLIFDCTERERLNPLDPQNPESAGRPRGLKIYSEYDRAVLRWDQLELNGILGYRIYCDQNSDLAFDSKALVLPDSNQYIDYGLAYEKKYDYFITAVGEDFETLGSDTVSIIPGPTIIWATDVYNRRIIKISHDSVHEIEQIPVEGYPWALAYNKENDLLWYTDVFLNRVYQIKSQEYKIVLDIPNSDPIDLIMDRTNNRIWIADQNQGKIYIFNGLGEKIGENGDIKKPASIDLVSTDGSCWVADSKAKTVTKISSNFTTMMQINDLINPTSIAVDQISGDCWVADSSRILKFDIKGRLRLTLEPSSHFLKYLAFDSALDYCWVLDFNFFANQSRLLCFDDAGNQILELSGLSWPENLEVNPYDHSCIVWTLGQVEF